jgi:predicted Zn-dependent peptidase
MEMTKMKKILIKEVEELLYYEKLENGLEIYMVPKKGVNNTRVTFSTRYGSVHNEFIPHKKKKMTKFPNGIAHFLEHKLFEQEDGVDTMIFFANRSADVNALTGFLKTSYLFYGSKHFEENLNFLLDYVQQPYFTDDNIEKEKGIIEQEIRMYDDMPYSVLFDKVRYNALKNHPLKHSIIGTVEEINSITKEQLYDCYNTFYHPANMFLIITGNFEPDKAVAVIKENQAKKKYDYINEILLKKTVEPNEVVKQYEETELNVEVPKLSMIIKIPIKDIDIEPQKRNLYLQIFFNTLLGATSLFNEQMRELDYIDGGLSIYQMYTDDHVLVFLSCDSKKTKELIDKIKEQFINIKIVDKEFERKKKAITASKIHLFENIVFLNDYIRDNILLYGYFDNDVLEKVNELDKKEFNKLIKKLDLTNITSFVVNPIKK